MVLYFDTFLQIDTKMYSIYLVPNKYQLTCTMSMLSQESAKQILENVDLPGKIKI